MFENIKLALVVDDDGLQRKITSVLLGRLGINCYEAENGQQATKVLGGVAIDLLVTDFRMPEMNGVELLDWCRANGFHFPVIFLSSEAKLVPAEKIALKDCCASLVEKPIRPRKLTSILRAYDARTHSVDCVHQASQRG